MRASWQQQFAERPDVLVGASQLRTFVSVRDFFFGGNEFIIMASPCSAETESRLVKTALNSDKPEQLKLAVLHMAGTSR